MLLLLFFYCACWAFAAADALVLLLLFCCCYAAIATVVLPWLVVLLLSPPAPFPVFLSQHPLTIPAHPLFPLSSLCLSRPPRNFYGSVTFVYEISDAAAPGARVQTWVMLIIDPPSTILSNNNTYYARFGEPYKPPSSMKVPYNDWSPTGEPLRVVDVSPAPPGFNFTWTPDGDFDFVPPANFSGARLLAAAAAAAAACCCCCCCCMLLLLLLHAAAAAAACCCC